eukprot:6840619-Pyramimonas_sp.AAC.1
MHGRPEFSGSQVDWNAPAPLQQGRMGIKYLGLSARSWNTYGAAWQRLLVMAVEGYARPVSYTHLRAHETGAYL